MLRTWACLNRFSGNCITGCISTCSTNDFLLILQKATTMVEARLPSAVVRWCDFRGLCLAEALSCRIVESELCAATPANIAKK